MPGDLIAVTAPSSGVTGAALARLDLLSDPEVSVVFPPWGGELASELLEHVDWAALRSTAPKWLLGFSDISTIQLPLTLVSGWATAHGTCLMDLVPTQTDPLTTAVLSVLSSDFRTAVVQRSSSFHQERWTDPALRVDAPFALTRRTEWKRLDRSSAPLCIEGCLVGGCVDTVAGLAGTMYGDVPGFIQRCGAAG